MSVGNPFSPVTERLGPKTGSVGKARFFQDVARRLSHLRHHATALRAGATGRDALLHIAQRLAGRGALFADLGALGANVRVVLRAAQHEVGADGADLRAVEHQAEMVWLDVRAAHFQAMGGQVAQTRRVTGLAIIDALLHFGCCVVDKNHLLSCCVDL